MLCKQLMRSYPEVMYPESSIQLASQHMRALDISLLPVCAPEHHWLLGTITEQDIIWRVVAEGLDPTSTPLMVAMTEHLICCYDNQNIHEAALIMAKHRLRRLPVIDEEKRLVGMISLSDIAASIRLHESGPSTRQAPRQAPEMGMADHIQTTGTN